LTSYNCAEAAATGVAHLLAMGEIMQVTLPFELARELKSAGFTQSTSADAVYALTEHLRIRREHALQMWYGSKRKAGLPLELEEDAVYTPTLSDLVTACGKPLQLGCNDAGDWKASAPVPDRQLIGEGETAEEALARLWIAMQRAT
jgi:hypothetical protein